jgi:hypothetical protein
MSDIYLRASDGFVRMSEAPYDAEAVLQQLIASHPELLAGDEDGQHGPWRLIRREATVMDGPYGAGRWWLDHLFVDRDGVLTLVEVKQSGNPEIRREVVGQMLEYAANAAHWTAEELRGWFDATCAQRGADPDVAIEPLLEEDETVDGFWARVRSNQAAGRLRLVFVADAVPPELRRIVEFLNAQMRETEVIAIEVKQYVDEASMQQTIVPRVLGRTEASRAAKGQADPGRSWDRRSLLEELRVKRGPAERDAAQRIIAWAERRPDLTLSYGTGRKDGSVTPGRYGDRYLFPFALFSYGRVTINFQPMSARPPFDDVAARERLRGLLNAIPGVEIEAGALGRRPSLRLEALTSESALDSFLQTMDWAFGLPLPEPE